MTRRRSQLAAGIEKGVCEAVYPADILADKEIRSCSPPARCAWYECLFIMWRDQTDRITDDEEGFARLWGMDVTLVSQIIREMTAKKPCRVLKSPGKITLVSRRLERRRKQRDANRLRKQKERERSMSRRSHSDVAPPKAPSSFSSLRDLTPVPPCGETVTVTPDAGLMGLTSRLIERTGWVGSPKRVVETVAQALEEFPAEKVNAGIEAVERGTKPWEWLDALRGRTNGRVEPSGPRVAQYDPGPALTPEQKAAAAAAREQALAKMREALQGGVADE